MNAGTPRFAVALSAAGGLTLALAFAIAPERAWLNLLLASYALATLGLAGVFFVAIQYVCGAGWSVALRRVPEAMIALLPVGAVGLLAIFLVHPGLYPWAAPFWAPAGEAVQFKRLWLSRPFFQARAAVYMIAWAALAWAIIRRSRRQDADGQIGHTRANGRLSAIFLVVGGFTLWLASYDWIMSLEPDWSSTIYGVYHFAGLFLAGLAMILLLTVRLRDRGPLAGVVTQGHLQDLGTLLFAFSTFWAYVWFSQYMLIWYANQPEETIYYIRRLHGPWAILFVLNLLLNWAIPFLAVLPRANKRNPGILAKAAIVVLLGRWLDLYLMIFPPSVPGRPVFGFWELGAVLGAVGVFWLVVRWAFRQVQPVPLRDPYLVESLHNFF
jgi:hypothetical protein